MLEALKKESNLTCTENGAVSYRSTMSQCLDLFAAVGALRHADDSEILTRFYRAYAENADLAMKILFYARDIRGGLGERRLFRTIVKDMAAHEPQSVIRNLKYIAEYGRWDDLLCLMDTPCEGLALQLIREQLQTDEQAMLEDGSVSLLAKWLPSVNASNGETVRLAKKIAHVLGMNDAKYRKLLVGLRKKIAILENNLREKDYSFDYEKQPGKAMFKYRQAFYRNDQKRYSEFLNKVNSGEADMHTGVLTPYEIIRPILDHDDLDMGQRQALETTWRAQDDFTRGENALVVVDGSGSMYSYTDPMPAAVALSLGIYYAERNRGVFRNHFITFSERPELVEIKGRDITEKVRYCERFNEVADTNLQRVFQLILDAAVRNDLPQSELPSRLYIITDMEFNECVDGGEVTNFEFARKLFAEHGYTLPEVIFWNVDSRRRQQPVTQNEQGVGLVSGYNPQIFSMLTSGTLTPYHFMLDTLMGERYAPIAA